MSKLCGIYIITHIVSGKVYVGQSRNIRKRWSEHTRGHKSRIGRAIKKHGVDSFHFEVIELCSPSELNDKEAYYITKFDSMKNGYNVLPGGGQFDMPDSVKIRIGNSQKKRYSKTPPKCFVTFSGGKQNAPELNVRPKIFNNGRISFSEHQSRKILKHMFNPTRLDNQIEPELWDIKGANKETVLNALFYGDLT